MGIIKKGIHINEQLIKDIDQLSETIQMLPEGKERYALEAELRMMRRLAENLKENSEELYDQLLDFSMRVIG